MQDSVIAGYFIVGLIILLFIVGTGSLLIDSVFHKPMDTFPPQLEPEDNKVMASYTVRFSKDDDDDISILC